MSQTRSRSGATPAGRSRSPASPESHPSQWPPTTRRAGRVPAERATDRAGPAASSGSAATTHDGRVPPDAARVGCASAGSCRTPTGSA
jgi:hypothetical protein